MFDCVPNTPLYDIRQVGESCDYDGELGKPVQIKSESY